LANISILYGKGYVSIFENLNFKLVFFYLTVPPISKCDRPCNEFTSVWSMVQCNSKLSHSKNRLTLYSMYTISHIVQMIYNTTHMIRTILTFKQTEQNGNKEKDKK